MNYNTNEEIWKEVVRITGKETRKILQDRKIKNEINFILIALKEKKFIKKGTTEKLEEDISFKELEKIVSNNLDN